MKTIAQCKLHVGRFLYRLTMMERARQEDTNL
jgi:hypothetical protein